MPKAKQYQATLIRGSTYTLLLDGGKRSLDFEKGKPKTVSEEEKDILDERAVDTVTVTGEGEDTVAEPRAKFKFTALKAADIEDEDADEDEDTDEDESEDESSDESAAAKPAKKQAKKQARNR